MKIQKQWPISCYVKKLFLKISQNSQENTCARFLLIFSKVAAGLAAVLAGNLTFATENITQDIDKDLKWRVHQPKSNRKYIPFYIVFQVLKLKVLLINQPPDLLLLFVFISCFTNM